MLRRALGYGLGSVAALVGGCIGNIGGKAGSDDGSFKDTPAAENEVGVSGARRLTSVEYRASVLDLVGVDVTDAELILPTDERTPFDNDFTQQTASQALIDGADIAAGEVAAEVVADPAKRAAIVPCEPSGPTDEACFRAFLSEFGRRALRRPLTEENVTRFVEHFFGHAATANDFWVAVDSALRAFMQHPEFLYRIEIGEPVAALPGVFRLNDFEVATRIAYLLWGSTPPDWLLDDAEAGALSDPDRRRDAVATLLEDPRALDRIARFHSMWLAYEQLPHAPALAASMSQETSALLERYLLEERRPWSELLLADETYLTPELATHYDLPAPAGEGDWVSYGDSGRKGLLSHGAFLSAVPKFEDTSPTQRGLLIRTRLFCQNIEPPPPELMVNVDEPPPFAGPDACKSEKYAMWKTDGCSMCHKLLEPVGFGLENYDTAGRYREAEPDKPECTIDGKGTLEGVGEFTGPAELGALLIEAGEIDSCVATMLQRFAAGRYELDGHDDALLERLVQAAQAEGGSGLDFVALVTELVASDAFRFRREEVVDE